MKRETPRVVSMTSEVDDDGREWVVARIESQAEATARARRRAFAIRDRRRRRTAARTGGAGS